MELLNEITTLCTLYMVMCFSDYVGEPTTRNNCGFGFIGVLGIFIATHVFFLIVSVVLAVRFSIRRRYYTGKRKAAEERINQVTLSKLPRGTMRTDLREAALEAMAGLPPLD